MSKINFQITTPEKTVYQAPVDSVTLTTEMGEITILPGHIPLVANLVPGEMQIKVAGVTTPYVVTGGFVEVRPKSEVVVLADAAEHVEEIDVKRAEEALKRAKDLMDNVKRDDVKFAEAAALLERSLTRIRVARKKRTQRHL